MKNRQQRRGVTRRDWLKAASGVVAAPYFVPASVFGAQAPSEQLAIGCIGTGRQGRADMGRCLSAGLTTGARVTAVCDVDSRRAQLAKQTVDDFYKEKLGKPLDCAVYSDYRELLDRKDLDGVTVTTPDHWHALVAIAAAEAGKDLYAEKPLTYTIAEGQKLVRAVRDHNCVLQAGSQQRSSRSFQKACELALDGKLGKLHTISVVLPPDKGTGKATPMPVPSTLNYNVWLGPRQKAPYTVDRVHPLHGFSRPGWLQIEDYCRGMITGWGAHMNDIAQWGAGMELSGPVEVEARGEFPDRGLFDVHTTFHAEATYPNGVKLLMDTGAAGVKFEGDDGWVHVTRSSLEASPKELLGDAPQTDKDERDNHMLNFLDCMKSRQDPVANVEIAHRSNSVCVLAHIAMKLGRKLQWDPEAEQFVDDDEANKWLDYPHRKPWVV